MKEIRSGQYSHLWPKYRKVSPPDLTKGLDLTADPKHYANARLLTIDDGLEQYNGEVTDRHIAHLLKRMGFGATGEDIKAARGQTLASIVDQYMNTTYDFPEPVNNYNDFLEGKIDPFIPVGQSFVRAPFYEDLEGDRIISLKAWMIERMLQAKSSIQEKMILFWWNYIPVKMWDVFVSKSCFRYFKMLERNCLGNVKTMMKELTMDPAMLVFLSGAFNNKNNPDENFGREIQELFCIGKGPGAGYTESDVQMTARVLTGWTIDWDTLHQTGDPVSFFNPNMHHTGNKTFSSFYGNRTIVGREGEAGAEELDELLDMLFATQECARHIARKLYAFFVVPEITEKAEANVIGPLATILRQNNYEIAPALRALLLSAHFYHEHIIGVLIKNPADFTIGFWKNFNMPLAQNPTESYELYPAILWQMGNVGMEVGDPPNVAGWPPYYQTPMFDRIWINADTITKRATVTDSMIFWGYWISNDRQIPAEVLSYVEKFDDPDDLYSVLRQFALSNLGIDLREDQIEQIRTILLSGQEEDYYWTGAWLTYQANKNQENRSTVLNRLRPAFQVLLQMAESQLM